MEPADQLDVVLVPVAKELYALPIGWVREVVTAPTLTRLATAPPMVLGLFNLRGEIVPLLDTASLLGVGRAGPVRFAVVLDTHLGIVGLSADGFPTRRLLDTGLGPSQFGGANTYRVDQQLAVLVDVQDLLDSASSPALHPNRVPATPQHALTRQG
jgi:purine-binding chemotaxis protein CheW